MTTSTTSDSSASTPLLDLQALVVAVRRRRRLWCSLALLGFVLGAAFAVLRPPPPTAATKVLVAHQEDQPNDTGTLIRTDVELLKTTRIASKALQALKSPEKPEDFMQDYRGTGITNNLMRIDVTADTEEKAVARAKALADAFAAIEQSAEVDVAAAEDGSRVGLNGAGGVAGGVASTHLHASHRARRGDDPLTARQGTDPGQRYGDRSFVRGPTPAGARSPASSGRTG